MDRQGAGSCCVSWARRKEEEALIARMGPSYSAPWLLSEIIESSELRQNN